MALCFFCFLAALPHFSGIERHDKSAGNVRAAMNVDCSFVSTVLQAVPEQLMNRSKKIPTFVADNLRGRV
jgi:hypothetical protein